MPVEQTTSLSEGESRRSTEIQPRSKDHHADCRKAGSEWMLTRCEEIESRVPQGQLAASNLRARGSSTSPTRAGADRAGAADGGAPGADGGGGTGRQTSEGAKAQLRKLQEEIRKARTDSDISVTDPTPGSSADIPVREGEAEKRRS